MMKVIAETAFNHNGDINYLIELIQEAKDSGADYITVQIMDTKSFCVEDYERYQIYIFGHSCGISDRTLLNTLFEHDNCVSIKPFYYQIDDDHDNYSEIIRNISRNFNSKSKMRDRVVNKTFCEPLVSIQKTAQSK